MPTQTFSQKPREQTLLGQYLGFLQHPHMAGSGLTFQKTLGHIWRLYSAHVLLMIPMLMVIGALSSLIPSIEENAVGDLLEKGSIGLILMLVVVAAPLIEELMFRLPLKFSGINFAITGGLISFIVMGGMMERFSSPTQGVYFFAIVSLLSIVSPLLLCQKITQRRGDEFFRQHLKLLIYVSSVIFGLVHITNYPTDVWWFFPILVLPQTTLGVLLAYVRLKFGYWWAVFTHALHNFLITSPLIFLELGSDQLRQNVLQSADLELSNQDLLVMTLMAIWFVGVASWILRTAMKLIMEWTQARSSQAL